MSELYDKIARVLGTAIDHKEDPQSRRLYAMFADAVEKLADRDPVAELDKLIAAVRAEALEEARKAHDWLPRDIGFPGNTREGYWCARCDRGWIGADPPSDPCSLAATTRDPEIAAAIRSAKP